jgi:hypothetical protein
MRCRQALYTACPKSEADQGIHISRTTITPNLQEEGEGDVRNTMLNMGRDDLREASWFAGVLIAYLMGFIAFQTPRVGTTCFQLCTPTGELPPNG